MYCFSSYQSRFSVDKKSLDDINQKRRAKITVQQRERERKSKSPIYRLCSWFGQVKAYGIGVCVAYPPDTDTPGYALESVAKPESTRLIAKSGGMFSPVQVSATLSEQDDRSVIAPGHSLCVASRAM